jgi:hypothetical protein
MGKMGKDLSIGKRKHQVGGMPRAKKKKRAAEKKKRPLQPKERVVEALTKRLMKSDFNFQDENLARSFANNGVAKTLLKLEKDGFHISEKDPLLIISVEMDDDDSIGYFNRGNYGIRATTDGHLAGPIPADKEEGPCAVGEFLAGYVGVKDLSGGDKTVLFFQNMGLLHAVRGEFAADPQFTRLGPTVAGLLGVNVQDPLVTFFTLDTMKSEPCPYDLFNQSI